MKKIICLTSLVIILLITTQCRNSTRSEKNPTVEKVQDMEVNPYMQKYAGGYIIEVNGIPNETNGELYILHQGGTAKWMWIEVQSGNQTKVLSEKLGTWTASADKITITIKGNTGNLIEEYSLINGKFTNGDRSLKKSE